MGILLGNFLYAEGSFEKTLGKTAVNLEEFSFRFGLGTEYKTDKWGNNNYSSFVIPLDLAFGLTRHVEIDLGVEYSKPYSFIDGSLIKDKASYHNLYAGARILMNPDTVSVKPAFGFWLGLYIPLHPYESWKPTGSFLLSSAIGNLFSWNFNLGFSAYLNRWDYKKRDQKKIAPGGEVFIKLELGYPATDFFKILGGIDMKQHFLGKRYFTDGSSKKIDEFSSWKGVFAARLKPVGLPMVFDAGVRVGFNKNADETLSIFFQVQIIPDSANAAW